MKTAILVDGGYYRKVALPAFGYKDPKESASELITYCMRHLNEKRGKDTTIHHDLYRIFYYDCPPIQKKVYHPLLKYTVDFSKTQQYEWMTSFLSELTKKRKVALRLGRLSESEVVYNLKYSTSKKLVDGSILVNNLKEKDFQLDTKQKGVDMKIGVDIASLSYKQQVEKIILIAGDSDFVPASKLARREGIDFILDSLGRKIKPDLFEHIDGLNYKDERLKKYSR